MIKNTTEFAMPNKYIQNYSHLDGFEFEILAQLCQRKDIGGYWKGHVRGLLNFSTIQDRYKTKALQFIRSIGGVTDGDYITIFVNGLFDFNGSTIIRYILVNYTTYSDFTSRELFKYYCYLIYNINLAKGCFMQTYEQLITNTGISKSTLVRYNKELLEEELIYYTNSGDLYNKATNTIINSSNFYSIERTIAEKRLEQYMTNKQDNLKWRKQDEKDITSNDKRRATQYIKVYSDKEYSTLTEEQQQKLRWALELYVVSARVDYSDSNSMKELKINSLQDRYKKQGLEFSLEQCKDLIEGNIKIIDLIESLDSHQ